MDRVMLTMTSLMIRLMTGIGRSPPGAVTCRKTPSGQADQHREEGGDPDHLQGFNDCLGEGLGQDGVAEDVVH